MKKTDILYTLGRIFIDTSMVFGALWVTYLVRMKYYPFFSLPIPTPFPATLFLESAINITLFLVFIFGIHGRYQFGTDRKIFDEISQIFWSFTSGLGILLILFFFLQKLFFSRFVLLAFWIVGLFCLIFGRILIRILRFVLTSFGYGKTKVLILGSQSLALNIIQILGRKKQYRLLGTLSETKDKQKKMHGIPCLGSFSDFESILQKHTPDEIIVAIQNSTHRLDPDWVRLAHIHGIQFRYIPDEIGLDLSLISPSTLESFPIITLRNTRIEGWGLVIKYIFDICCSLVLIVLLSPLLLLIAFLVWIEYPQASCIYKSKRIGKKGVPFSCYKFRSMIPEAEKLKETLLKQNERKGGVLFKMKNDPRVTRLGKFLRVSSLDELPQLFNVLHGDMSIIGPRPHLPEEVNQYEKNDLRVLSIKPGITGFSQINGRSSLQFQEEIQYELFYIKNWSLWLDLIIFFKSIWIVLKRVNVS